MPFYSHSQAFVTKYVGNSTTRNAISIGALGIGIVLTLAGSAGRAWRVETSDNERLLSSEGAGVLCMGSGSSPCGSSGQVLTNGGGSGALMSWTTPAIRAGSGGSLGVFIGSGAVMVNISASIEFGRAVTLTDVRIEAKEAPTGAAFIVDINENGSTVFSTRPQINDGETESSYAHVFSDTSIAADSEITFDLDQVGSTFAGERITIQLFYR